MPLFLIYCEMLLNGINKMVFLTIVQYYYCQLWNGRPRMISAKIAYVFISQYCEILTNGIDRII